MKCRSWSIVIQASHLENNVVNDGDDEGEDNKAVNDAKLELELHAFLQLKKGTRNQKLLFFPSMYV